MAKLETSLRYEDRLDGLSNYSPWKEMIRLVLLVNKIWEFADKEIAKPTTPKNLAKFEELDAKAKLIILDGVKDHLIPHLIARNTAYDLRKALQDLFQNKNVNRLMVLREKLKSTKMLDGEGVALYLTKLSQVHEELVVIGDNVPE